MPKVQVTSGQIWRDECYYLDRITKKCQRKYFLVLAVDIGGDPITAVFTSRPNGLTENPACCIGPPRAGHFIGVPGGVFIKPTWVDFSSLNTLDIQDLALHVSSGRTQLILQTLSAPTLRAVLRCLLQSDDITKRQARCVADTLAVLNCS